MTRKRRRRLRADPGQLIAYYGYDSDGNGPDITAAYGGAGAAAGDANCLLEALSTKVYGDLPFWKELAARGYDLDTLKFTIRKRAPATPAGQGAPDAAT